MQRCAGQGRSSVRPAHARRLWIAPASMSLWGMQAVVTAAKAADMVEQGSNML